jgi:uncharacterized protein
MKALLALVIIYVGTFLIVVQGASQNSVQAAHQGGAGQGQTAPASIDPAKEADIRSLMELVGARDLAQEAMARGTEQFRENLVASVPDSERGQQFVNAFLSAYEKKFNADDVANQVAAVYDKHFTDDDIRGLLQFYGSPLGQKYAAEMPKIAAEIQAANHAAGTKIAKEVLQDLRKQYPGIGAQARLAKSRRNGNAQSGEQTQPDTQSQASVSQP